MHRCRMFALVGGYLRRRSTARGAHARRARHCAHCSPLCRATACHAVFAAAHAHCARTHAVLSLRASSLRAARRLLSLFSTGACGMRARAALLGLTAWRHARMGPCRYVNAASTSLVLPATYHLPLVKHFAFCLRARACAPATPTIFWVWLVRGGARRALRARSSPLPITDVMCVCLSFCLSCIEPYGISSGGIWRIHAVVATHLRMVAF